MCILSDLLLFFIEYSKVVNELSGTIDRLNLELVCCNNVIGRESPFRRWQYKGWGGVGWGGVVSGL